ncbi:hypothetical protein [Arcticibacterium luteifluviistationis]|uniref:Uncharacterized protein n=1 Tax=Arcticibacterium luteifluviistationis TaxID=1784714 RepID=A0A2Z4GA75_9BACT|nr:hypothetical protein [Arcticibacterium luteifluviistationis]AWV98054.1 hypothetical protein DJ013_07665 [Arcticibacterium luteifluviistationis]
MTKATLKRLSFLLILGLISCNPEESSIREKTFYDLETVIQNEIDWLSEHKPTVKKSVRINDETEELSTNDIDWKKELEIIIQSDLNKAAYKLSYNETDSLNKISYKIKEGEKLPVASLDIWKNKNGTISRIASVHITDNYLYSSTKNIVAEFSKGHLAYYDIKGYQQLFVGTKKSFDITGFIDNKGSLKD